MGTLFENAKNGKNNLKRIQGQLDRARDWMEYEKERLIQADDSDEYAEIENRLKILEKAIEGYEREINLNGRRSFI